MTVAEAMAAAQKMKPDATMQAVEDRINAPPGQQVLVSPATASVIQSDYSALGVVTGYNPPKPTELCMLLLAQSGGGKTTFLSSIPRCLCLIFDKDGASSIPSPQAHRVLVNGWDKPLGTFAGTPCVGYIQIRDKLIADAAAGRRAYDVIAIDTADEWFLPIAEHVVDSWNKHVKEESRVESVADVGQKGKGFGEAAYVMETEVMRLRRAGYGVILTAHLAEKRINKGGQDIDVIRPVLSPACYKALIRRAAYMGQIVPFTFTIGTKKIQVGDKTIETQYTLPPEQQRTEYRLLLKGLEAADESKKRLPHMPDYVVIPRKAGWRAFELAYATAAEASSKE
jgi:hypothetical protein